jgi:hypothetical protein
MFLNFFAALLFFFFNCGLSVFKDDKKLIDSVAHLQELSNKIDEIDEDNDLIKQKLRLNEN